MRYCIHYTYTIILSTQLIVQKLVHDDQSLQMTVVHATQVFCHGLDFPKGVLSSLL